MIERDVDHADTLGEVVALRAAADPDGIAVILANRPATYGRLHLAGNQIATGLASLGLVPGDRVALLLPNSVEFLQTWVGLSAGGFVEVPLNVALKGMLLADQLRRSNAQVVVVDQASVARIDEVRADLPGLRAVVVVNDQPTPTPAGDHLRYDELLAAGSCAPPAARPDPFAPSSIMFTSGTSGPSKGVVRSHAADMTLARETIRIMGYGPADVLYSAFPLYHLNAKFNSVLAAMLCGGRLVLHDRFSASRFWDTCRIEGVTAFNFMGALLTMLLKQPERSDDADNPVTRAYGAPAPESLLVPFETRFGVRLVEVYGSTELGIAARNTVDSRTVGASGRPAPSVELEIHDPDDREVDPGVTGEICVRPREPGVIFDRYHDMPSETLAAFRNLWFHSGDRGFVDEQGCLHFVDRKTDAVRRRGENISSFEVEKVIGAHPDVAACAVIGVPDDVSGEEVAAYLVAQPDVTIDPIALLDHCQAELPHFAVPRYLIVVDSLPLTPSQRVEKYRLRAAGLPDDAWDRSATDYVVKR